MNKLIFGLTALLIIAVQSQSPVSANDLIKDYKPNAEWLASFRLMRQEWSYNVPAGGPTTLRTPEFTASAGDMWAAVCYKDANMNYTTIAPAVWQLNSKIFKTVTRRYSTRFATNTTGVVDWTITLEAHPKLTCVVRSINALDLQP